MKYLILSFFLFFFTLGNAQGLVDSLNNILNDLPPGDRGQFFATYRAAINPKDETITIIESRHTLDMSITDSIKGYYTVHLNDLDPENLTVQDMPNQQFRIYLPCIGEMPKSKLYVRSEKQLHGEYLGTNISLGFWKDDSSRLKCEAFIDRMKELVQKAKPKPINISSFNERTTFKVTRQINFVLNEQTQEYEPTSSNENLRKIIFQHQQMVIVYGGKTEVTYPTSSIGLEPGSDQIKFDVEHEKIKVILVEPNGHEVSLIGPNFKVVYKTEAIVK